MNIAFERATLGDIDALVKIQVLAFNHDSVMYPGVALGGPPGYTSPDVMLEKMRTEDYYAMRADGQLVGGMGIFNMGQGHYHLDVIYIDPAYHNRGIGSQAITFMQQIYPNAKKWTLNTPSYATRNHHFYEKFGFVKVGETIIEANFVLLDYEKRL